MQLLKYYRTLFFSLLSFSVFPQFTFYRYYGCLNNDRASAALQSPDNGYIITGETYSYGTVAGNSNTVINDIYDHGILKIDLYPNPARNKFNIKYEMPQASSIMVSVFASYGKMVISTIEWTGIKEPTQ